jgi:hypothetical protein
MRRCLSFVLPLLLFSLRAYSQTTSTTILGTVTDTSGAAIAGAKVTTTNVNTGIKREDKTSEAGDYSFPLLDVGQYSVTVEAKGFKTETQTGIELQINQKARVDFRGLQIGSQSETVTITGEVAQLKTDEASIGSVVEQRRVVELPLNGRNLAGLAVMQPGVQFGGRMGFDGLTGGGGGVPIAGQAISISANGQRDTNMHGTLDGVVATEPRVNTIPFAPSTEAVEEFKVLSGSYSAEYGTNSGAQVMIITKSGSNQMHGSLFEFFRNDTLDAESYFQNYFNSATAARKPKDKLRQNQFGGVWTGPVWIPKLYNGKDKTFFMVNYEHRTKRQPGITGTANVPTEAMKNGDLSAFLNRPNAAQNVAITDPLTGTPFAGNIIPPTRISPTAKALMPFFPVSQSVKADPITGNNFIGEGGIKQDEDQVFVRGDHNFSGKDKIFGRYAFQDITYFTTPGDNPAFQYFVAGRNQNVATQWLHIFSPTLINELRYGYNRSVDNTLNPRSNTSFDLDTLGLTGFRLLTDNNRKFTTREAGLPTFNINGFTTLGDRDGGNGFDFNDVHQVNDNVTYTRGKHNMKFGVDYRWVGLFRGAANTARGDLTFSDNIARNAFAAFLLGYPSSSNSPEGLPLTQSRQNRYAAYVQDDWKASQRLTVNIGVRYEYNSMAKDIRGLWRTLDFSNKVDGFPTLAPIIRNQFNFYDPQKTIFMPRLGLAYRLSEKTVLRSGFGIYYNVHQLNNYTVLNLNPPLSGSSSFSSGADVTGKLLLATPLTFAQPFGVVNSTSAINANTLDHTNLEPYVTQWSLDVQRQLPGRQVLTVGYVGSKGTNIDSTIELNNPDPAFDTATSTTQSRRPIQFVIDGPGGPKRPLTRVRFLTNGSNSWYHGLQVNYEKRMSRGLQFGVAYTYSQSLGENYGRNESFGGTSNTLQNPRDRRAEKGRYPFDVRHNLVANFLYEVPTFSGWNSGIARQALGGWQLNGIYTARTGFPFNVTQTNTMNTANSQSRPDRNANGTLSSPTVDRWFDTSAFTVLSCQDARFPERCHYGNSGVGILDGPGFNSLDFSVIKNFRVREGMNAQFRTEFFNIANHPNFNIPNRNLRTGPSYLPSTPGGADPIQNAGAKDSGQPGQITSTITPMRIIQLALRFTF